MQVLEKRTSEQVRYDIDMSALLAAGETISSVSQITAEPTTVPAVAFGTTAINGSPITYTDAWGSSRTAPAGTVVQVVISGGKIATGAQVQDYTIRCKVVTNISPLVEGTVVLRVKDTP